MNKILYPIIKFSILLLNTFGSFWYKAHTYNSIVKYPTIQRKKLVIISRTCFVLHHSINIENI